MTRGGSHAKTQGELWRQHGQRPGDGNEPAALRRAEPARRGDQAPRGDRGRVGGRPGQGEGRDCSLSTTRRGRRV